MPATIVVINGFAVVKADFDIEAIHRVIIETIGDEVFVGELSQASGVVVHRLVLYQKCGDFFGCFYFGKCLKN